MLSKYTRNRTLCILHGTWSYGAHSCVCYSKVDRCIRKFTRIFMERSSPSTTLKSLNPVRSKLPVLARHLRVWLKSVSMSSVLHFAVRKWHELGSLVPGTESISLSHETAQVGEYRCRDLSTVSSLLACICRVSRIYINPMIKWRQCGSFLLLPTVVWTKTTEERLWVFLPMELGSSSLLHTLICARTLHRQFRRWGSGLVSIHISSVIGYQSRLCGMRDIKRKPLRHRR